MSFIRVIRAEIDRALEEERPAPAPWRGLLEGVALTLMVVGAVVLFVVGLGWAVDVARGLGLLS